MLKKILVTMAVATAILAGPAYATVVANFDLANGIINYNDAGGLTNSNLGGSYSAIGSADYTLNTWDFSQINPAANYDFVLSANGAYWYHDNNHHAFNESINLDNVSLNTIMAGINANLDYFVDSSANSILFGLRSSSVLAGIVRGEDTVNFAGNFSLRTAVPEPAPITLLALGLLTMGFITTKRRNR